MLSNQAEQDGAAVAATYRRLLTTMAARQAEAGPLAGAVAHFLKVTASYQLGLFACYDVPGLPRTNNDLEHAFGAVRYHERRATGRKGLVRAWSCGARSGSWRRWPPDSG